MQASSCACYHAQKKQMWAWPPCSPWAQGCSIFNLMCPLATICRGKGPFKNLDLKLHTNRTWDNRMGSCSQHTEWCHRSSWYETPNGVCLGMDMSAVAHTHACVCEKHNVSVCNWIKKNKKQSRADCGFNIMFILTARLPMKLPTRPCEWNRLLKAARLLPLT